MTDVVSRSAPFLARDDVKVVFDKARSSGCWRSLDETGRLRVQLLEAINDRDPGEDARSTARRCCGSRSRAWKAIKQVALTAALAGCLATGRLDEARALWSRYGTLFSRAAQDSAADPAPAVAPCAGR